MILPVENAPCQACGKVGGHVAGCGIPSQDGRLRARIVVRLSPGLWLGEVGSVSALRHAWLYASREDATAAMNGWLHWFRDAKIEEVE